MKLLSNFHIYPIRQDRSGLETTTPTYDDIVRQGDDVIPQGKRNCIKSVGTAAFFSKYNHTKNAQIPPLVFRQIDRLKFISSADMEACMNDIRASLAQIDENNINYRSAVHNGGTVLHAACAAYDVADGRPVPTGLIDAVMSVRGIDPSIRNDSG